MAAEATSTIVENKKELIRTIELLSDSAVLQAKGYIERLLDEETAGLESVHTATPNAETQAALEELLAGQGEKVTINQIMAELNARN